VPIARAGLYDAGSVQAKRTTERKGGQDMYCEAFFMLPPTTPLCPVTSSEENSGPTAHVTFGLVRLSSRFLAAPAGSASEEDKHH
jgi:hypothetical protein